MTTDERSQIERSLRRAREDPAGVSLEPIESALDHRDDRVGEQAVKTLYVISKTDPDRVLETIPRLVSLLERERSTIRTKAMATIRVVGASHPDVLAPHAGELVEALADESAMVRKGAVEALRDVSIEDPALGTAAVPRLTPLLESASEPTRLHATCVLESIATDHPDAVDANTIVEPLLEVLEDPYERPTDVTFDPKMAAGAVDPTSQLDGHRLLVMDDAGQEANGRARERAAATIATVIADDPAATASVVEPLLPRLFDLVDDPDPVLRGAIIDVLATVARENPAAVEPVESKLVDALADRIVVGTNAVRTLRFIESDRAIEALRAATSDDDVTLAVQAAAEDALAAIESQT